ncbi:unnamed protein product [Urochloa humidicola]
MLVVAAGSSKPAAAGFLSLTPAGALGAPAVAAAAALGSGRSGGLLSFAVSAGSEVGNTAAAADSQVRYEQFVQVQGDAALALLSELVPGADRTERFDDLSGDVCKLVASAKAGEVDKLGSAVDLAARRTGSCMLHTSAILYQACRRSRSNSASSLPTPRNRRWL